MSEMKIVVLVAAVLVMGTVAIPAEGSHPTRQCIDAEPDFHYGVVNDGKTDRLRVSLGVSDDENHPPKEGCITEDGTGSGQETEIDFEITGESDPDDSDTPESPDRTCTIPRDDDTCRITPPSSAGGFQVTRAWVDADNSNATVEADLNEGQDESEDPGEVEPDFTDVVYWGWTHRDEGPTGRSFDVRVTIRFDDNEFHGRVFSDKDRCFRYRIVTLRQLRDGEAVVVARVKANERGRWFIGGGSGPRGRFYVRVRQHEWTTRSDTHAVCENDRSPTIRVP
ncbi:MAG TPA: hypothetical protein VNP73_07805 [Actinomycetota bacterium]|nr:hypothetical protein [Actinomycetota bacterium]